MSPWLKHWYQSERGNIVSLSFIWLPGLCSSRLHKYTWDIPCWMDFRFHGDKVPGAQPVYYLPGRGTTVRFRGETYLQKVFFTSVRFAIFIDWELSNLSKKWKKCKTFTNVFLIVFEDFLTGKCFSWTKRKSTLFWWKIFLLKKEHI